MLRKETISAELLKLLTELQHDETYKDYYLAGGTSLALQIGHRISDDIDLFTTKPQDTMRITNNILRKYPGESSIFRSDNNVLQAEIRKINVDFISVPINIIETPIEEDDLKLLDKKDIAAMKLLAVVSRKTAKDYIDIAYLLSYFTLLEMFDFFKSKYECTDISNVKKALCESNRVNPYLWDKVKMTKNDIYLSDIPNMIKNAVLAYNKKTGISTSGKFSP